MGLGVFLDWIFGIRKTAISGAGFVASQPRAIGEGEANLSQNVASVYAAIHAYTDSISTIDFGPVDATKDEYTPLQDHQYYNILHDEFNPEQTSQQALCYAVGSLFLRGNMAIQIIRTRSGNLVELNPLDWQKVKRYRSDGRILFRVDGEATPLEDREVIYLPINYSPSLLCGISTVAYAQTSIGLGLALDNFGYSYFSQGAQPRVVLEHPGLLDEKQAKQIVDAFNGMMSGPANANKTGILYGGTKLNKYGIPPEEAQFLETRKFSVNEIARWFNLPPSRIGGERASGTYANLEQDQRALIVHSLRPVCRMIEQEFDRKLLTPEQRRTVRIKFDLDDLLASVEGAPDAEETPEETTPAATRNTVPPMEDDNADE